MKPSASNNTHFSTRRALFASFMVLLLGAATAVAQTSSTSGSSGARGTSGSDTSRSQTGATSGSSGTYDRSGSTRSSTSATDPRTDAATGPRGSTATTTATSDDDKLSWGERRFVKKTADYGHDEKQIAELAAQRASNSEVRSYAQKLVQDHEKVNSELKSLAQQKNVELKMDDDKARAYERLNKKSGSEFDQEFVEHMIDAHERDIERFEEAAEDAEDSQVRQFATKHVASLREHLRQAQNLRQTLMPTGRMDDRSGRSSSGATTGSGLGTSSTDSSSTSGTTGTTRSSTSDAQRDASSTGATSGATGTTGSGSTPRPSTTDRDR